VKQAHDGSAEYLGLSDGNLHHHAKTATQILYREASPGLPEESNKLAGGIPEYSQGDQEGNQENNLLVHKEGFRSLPIGLWLL